MIPFMGGRQIVSRSGVVTPHRDGLGKGFRGLGRYLQEGSQTDRIAAGETPAALPLASSSESVAQPPRAIWVETHHVPSKSIEGATRYMEAYAWKANARVQRPVYHFGVSLHPEETLTRDQWRDVTQTMLQRLGLEHHQSLAVAHGDKDYQHVHIVVNRVGPDGRVWKPRHDRRIQQTVARESEIKYGLRRVPTLKDRRLEQLRTLGINPADHAGSPYFSAELEERVSALRAHELNEATSWDQLQRVLAEKLVFLEPAKRGTGLVLTDGYDRQNFSAFNRNYSGPRLADRFGETYREYLERTGVAELEVVPDLDPEPLHLRVTALLEEVGSKNAVFTPADLKYLTRKDPEPDRLVHAALSHKTVLEVSPGRFAQKKTVQLEQQLLASSDRIAARSNHALDPVAVERLLQTKYSYLNEGQANAVRDATTGKDLRMIIGYAGSGKTTLTNAITEAYKEAGYTVLGASPTGAAAERLQAETGLESRTLASWASTWKYRPMARKTVLVVDEAGLADTATTAKMLRDVEKSGGKVIPVGDGGQLTPVGAGNPFPILAKRHGASVVNKILRQKEPWQRKASQHLAIGRVEGAIDAYRAHHNFHLFKTEQQAIDGLIERHFAHRNLHPTENHVMLTHSRAHAAEITRRIRDARQNIGELRSEVLFGKLAFAVGDQLRFRRNDHIGRYVKNLDGLETAVGVKNGSIGTVASVSAESLTVRLDTGRMVQFDPREYGRFVHGYAMTIHAAQGLTVDRASVYATPTLDKHLTNVAFTRHRKGLEIYADSESFDSLDHFKERLSRSPRVDMASAQVDDVEVFSNSDVDYLRQGLADIYVEPSQALGALNDTLASSDDRGAIYQELIEDPTRLGTLRPGQAVAETAQRHFRNALALSEETPTAEATLSTSTATGPPADADTPPPLPINKSAENALRQVSADLQRWDRLEEDLRRVTGMRQALPDRGNLLSLEKHLPKATPLPADQAEIIYRDPAQAIDRFAKLEVDAGLDKALSQLRESPEAFGELRGMPVLRPEPRRKAMEAVDSLTTPERIAFVRTIPRAYQQARSFQDRQKALQASLSRIAPNRPKLIERLVAAASRVPPRRAADLVAADQRRLLQPLTWREMQDLKALNQLASMAGQKRFKGFRRKNKLLKQALRARGLLRNPNARLLRELTPAKLRVVYTLRNLAITAKKWGLLPEEQAARERI